MMEIEILDHWQRASWFGTPAWRKLQRQRGWVRMCHSIPVRERR